MSAIQLTSYCCIGLYRTLSAPFWNAVSANCWSAPVLSNRLGPPSAMLICSQFSLSLMVSQDPLSCAPAAIRFGFVRS